MDLRAIGGGWGEWGGDSPGSGWGSLSGCCECGDEPSGSGATKLVINQSDRTFLFVGGGTMVNEGSCCEHGYCFRHCRSSYFSNICF
jgi:hypothetical protein